MDAVLVTVRLPADLVERAKLVGLQIEDENPQVVEAIEAQVRRLEAGGRMRQIMDQIQALSDDLKPSLEEIDDAVRGYGLKWWLNARPKFKNKCALCLTPTP